MIINGWNSVLFSVPGTWVVGDNQIAQWNFGPFRGWQYFHHGQSFHYYLTNRCNFLVIKSCGLVDLQLAQFRPEDQSLEYANEILG